MALRDELPAVDGAAPIDADALIAHSMRETFAFARLLYPHATPRESLRRPGGLSVPALLSSPFGKLAFGFVRLSPLVMRRAAPSSSRSRTRSPPSSCSRASRADASCEIQKPLGAK